MGGNDKCCAPCPAACLSAAAARQQCSSQCQRYSGNSKCCFSETAEPTTRRPGSTTRRQRTTTRRSRTTTSRPKTTTRRSQNTLTRRSRDTTTRRTTRGTTRSTTTRRSRPQPTAPRQTPRPTTTRRTTRPSRPQPSTRRPSPTPSPSASPVVAETCPSDCTEAFRRRETLAKCKQFKDEYKDCYYEKCSEECKTSASRGETNPKCRKHLGDKECYVPPSTCPGECSAGGVPECGGVEGCCPERYDSVYGVGLYADEDGLLDSNNRLQFIVLGSSCVITIVDRGFIKSC